MFKENDLAPSFELKDQSGNLVKLSSFKGKKVVLYFYPKDDTPGCTIEACEFRDSINDFKNKNVVILGVSGDSEESHKKFIQKHNLNFTLLCDVDFKVSKMYDSFGEKSFMGKTFKGILRKTYLINEEGRIIKIFDKVTPKGHSSEVVNSILDLAGAWSSITDKEANIMKETIKQLRKNSRLRV